MSRPIEGKEAKKLISIRLEPWIIKEIEKEFKTKSNGINEILKRWISNKQGQKHVSR